MRDNFVLDPLIGKRQQYLLATQLCRMVLKVNDGNDILTQPLISSYHFRARRRVVPD